MISRPRVWRFILGLVAPLAVCGCPPSRPLASSSPPFLHEGSDIRHAASGVTFPVMVLGFQRISARAYNRTGTDISVGYNQQRPLSTVVATVYVYPPTPLTSFGSPDYVVEGARSHLTQVEFEGRKQEVLRAHPGASLIEESKVALSESGAAYEGWHASFTYMQQMPGGAAALRSDLYVFGYIAGRWNLEYRFSYPASINAVHDIDDFMRALKINATAAGGYDLVSWTVTACARPLAAAVRSGRMKPDNISLAFGEPATRHASATHFARRHSIGDRAGASPGTLGHVEHRRHEAQKPLLESQPGHSTSDEVSPPIKPPNERGSGASGPSGVEGQSPSPSPIPTRS